MPTGELLVAGAGIGGLAAALCASQAGWRARVLERADTFGEVGAGIQLGPNATRLLAGWGLQPALEGIAAYPQQLVVRGAARGERLAALPLGAHFRERYGAPYATLHRRDLHALLYRAARDAGMAAQLGCRIGTVAEAGDRIVVRGEGGCQAEGDGLVGADGLWSAVRSQADPSAPAPQPSGHVAYRAMVAQHTLPAALRSHDVCAWLGPHLHAVCYPVRGGDWLNLVVVVGDGRARDAADWDHAAAATELLAAIGDCHASLADRVRAVDGWSLWVLSDVPPLRRAMAMAQGRIALLGDAAHAMPPYLAQGAGMALEDADALGRALAAATPGSLPAAFTAYAEARWRRNAWVQRRARRNGRLFHATGPLRWARDLALRVGGARVLDVPRLYAYSAGTLLKT